jgi:hypothetical protein
MVTNMNVGLNIKGHTVIIDESDLSWVSKYTWRIHPKEKYVMSFTSRAGGKKAKTLYLHRMILGLTGRKGIMIDHRNRNPLDNRVCNLRVTDYFTNNSNRRLADNKTAKYRGVLYATEKRGGKNKKYLRASIKVDGKTVHLGSFKTETEAALAYNIAAIKYRGKKAILNDIPFAYAM